MGDQDQDFFERVSQVIKLDRRRIGKPENVAQSGGNGYHLQVIKYRVRPHH